MADSPAFHGPFDRALKTLPFKVEQTECGSRVKRRQGNGWVLVLVDGATAYFVMGLVQSRRYSALEAKDLAYDVRTAMQARVV